MTNVKNPRSAFQPGEWLGPVAAGTGRLHTAAVSSAVSNAKVGERAAKVYPWMMCVKVLMPSLSTSPVMRVTRTAVGTTGEPTFYNDSNRTVKINEIRFVAMPPSNVANANDTVIYYFDLARRFGTTIKHSDYDIVRDFLPLYALPTYNNASSSILDASMSFSLPSAYLNPRSSAFQMRSRCEFASTASLSTQAMGIALCGRDTEHNPYVLTRSALTTVNGTIFAFNENTGGGPVKDQVLTDVNFNISNVLDLPGINYLWGLQNEVQFIPPEGPRWHSPLDWFPVNGIVNQGNSFVPSNLAEKTIVDQQNWVSYRPVTPHVVTPRQQLTVDLKCYQDSSYTTADGQRSVYTTPIWVIMLGTQESLA